MQRRASWSSTPTTRRRSSAATAEMGLDESERADLRRMDRDALVARGAHPYLIFMAGLRLKMAAEPSTLEYF